MQTDAAENRRQQKESTKAKAAPFKQEFVKATKKEEDKKALAKKKVVETSSDVRKARFKYQIGI